MKYLRLILCIIISNSSILAQQPTKVISSDDLFTLLGNNDKILVLNFWATWCRPCIQELPEIQKLDSTLKIQKKGEVIFISLDFKSNFESKLKPFIKKRKLNSKVYLLDDINYDSWIPKLSKEWDGSLPATFIYSSKSLVYEKNGQSTYEELIYNIP